MRRMMFAAIALALWGAPAFAQPAPWQPERLTAGWTFTPGFVLGTMWDSNVAVQPHGHPELATWSALLSPRGEIDFNGRQTHFNTGYSGVLEQYRGASALNRYEQRGRFDVRHQRTERLEFTSNASYMVAPTTDRLDIGAGSLPFVDVGSRLFDASGGFKLAVSRRTSLEGTYRFQDIEFDRGQTSTNPHPFLFSGHAHSPVVRVMHELTPRFSAGGAWEYRHADIGGGEQTIDVNSGTGEVSYRVSMGTTITGGAGLSYLSVSTTTLTATGPSFHGGIEHHEGQLVLSAAYERAFLPSFGLGGLTANQSMSADAFLPFAQGRYYISGGIAYRRTAPVSALGVGYRLDSTWLNAAAGYQVARWLRAEGFLVQGHQNSTARGLIDRTRIGIQFVTFKPVRIE